MVPFRSVSLTFLCLSCSPINVHRVHRDIFRDVEGVYISTHIGSARLQTRGLSSLGLLFGLCWPYVRLGGPATGEWYKLNKPTEEELLHSFWLLQSSSPGAFATTFIFWFFLCYCLEKVWYWTEDLFCHWTTSPTEENEFRIQRKKWRGEKKEKMKRRRHSSSLSHGLCSLSWLQCTNLGKCCSHTQGGRCFFRVAV